MAHFPLFISLSGKKCLVAGGGAVAFRKVKTLLSYGAHVEVAALEARPDLSAVLPTENLRTGLVREEDLEGAALVVAATGSRQENHRIALLCRERQIPVNVADCPDECTFFFPAVVKRGEISIGINTGGRSPGLSRHIRRQIEEAVPDYYADVAVQIGDLRETLKESLPDEDRRRRIFGEILERATEKGRPLTEEEIRDVESAEPM